MKKLLMASIILTLFACSVFIFQLSCSKKAEAQPSSYTLPPATTTTLGGVIVGNGLSVTSNGILSVNSSSGLQQLNKILFVETNSSAISTFYISNYDGTNKTAIPIVLPPGRTFASTAAHGVLSPDGQKIFFEVWEASTSTKFIYSCSVNGTNLNVVASSNGAYLNIQGAY